MSTLEKVISGKLKKYLRDVRSVLESNGIEKEEINDLLDNLRCHVLETATHHMEKLSVDDAVNRTIASLEAPGSYASYTSQLPIIENKLSDNKSSLIGIISSSTMIVALILAILFSQQKLFDTPLSGLVFIFGEMLALGTGVATWPNVWAKVGALCSALLLTFLITAFLWVSFSKTM